MSHQTHHRSHCSRIEHAPHTAADLNHGAGVDGHIVDFGFHLAAAGVHSVVVVAVAAAGHETAVLAAAAECTAEWDQPRQPQ